MNVGNRGKKKIPRFRLDPRGAALGGVGCVERGALSGVAGRRAGGTARCGTAKGRCVP